MKLPLRVLQLGAIGVVLAVTFHKAFELDRFLIPKELALHLTAFVAGVLLVRRMTWTRVDWLLTAYLGLSALSVLFAQNRWIGLRAFAVSASAILIFWIARALREAGLQRAVLAGIGIAIVAAAVTSLMQTYGLETELFSINRAPGGTLGNRNFIGHTAAFGLPVLLAMALLSRRLVVSCGGVALVVMTLVLTRSRAAWLASAAVLFVMLAAILMSRALRRDASTWRRLLVVLLIAAGGAAAALLIPNALRWRSDNPYLESMKSVANYEKGSGHGRLIQYERSLLMAVTHPIFGVGPGNWPVRYPRYAATNDPSLDDSEPGMTFNPWPSSDWIAIVSERGIVATLALLDAALLIALAALRRLRAAEEAEEALLAATLLATLAGAGIAGAFDAVLLLAEPALLVFAALGALYVPSETRRARPAVIAIVIVAALIGAIRSGMQIAAMELSARGERTTLERAAQLDPGNFRVQLRLARIGKRRERCEHAQAAVTLFPTSQAARAAARGCE